VVVVVVVAVAGFLSSRFACTLLISIAIAGSSFGFVLVCWLRCCSG
jgi:hypothetical protein